LIKTLTKFYVFLRIKDTLVWVKKGNEGKLRSNTGLYIRHAKEICILALKGNLPEDALLRTFKDVLISKPRENSRKPEKLYKIAEGLCPKGLYLELFGRRHNMRKGWVTVGNQIDEEEYEKGMSLLRKRKRSKDDLTKNSAEKDEQTFTNNLETALDDTDDIQI
jgi:N6-adenosine-specific RNA methylase IME4